MRAVLDTNVIVSAVISEHGAPRLLLEAWAEKRFELLTAPALIVEVSRTLRYPKIMQRYRLREADVRSVLLLLWTQGVVVEDPSEVEPLTGDPADDLVLAVGRAGEADFVVTGDRVLLGLETHHGARIVSPRVCVDWLNDQ